MTDLKGPTNSSALPPETAADVKALAGGGGLQILGQLIPRGLSLVFTGVAVRVLGAAGYGLYRQVAQVLNVAGILGSSGFEYAVVKEVASARATSDPGRVRGSVRIAVLGTAVASTLVMVGVVLLSPQIAGAFTERGGRAETLAHLLRLGSPFIPMFALSQVLRFSTHPYRTMVPSVVVGHVVRPTTRFLFGVTALATGFAVSGAVFSLVFSAGASLLAAAWYALRIPDQLERTTAPTSQTGALVRFAFLQGSAALLNIQTLGLGIIILGLYRSDAEVGVFGIALSLLAPVNILFTGIAPIWAPLVAELIEKQQLSRLEELFQTVNRWLSTFGFPVLAALIIQPDVFIEIVAGRSGRVAETAVIILAAGHLFYVGTGPTSFILSMSGFPGVNLAYAVISVLLCAVLGAIVVPEHGILGMAWVMTIVTVFGNVGRVAHVRALIGIQPFGKTFFKPVLATLVGAIPLVLATLVDSIGWDLASVAASGVVYLLALRMMGLDPQEAYVFDKLRGRLRSLRRR